MLRKVRRHVFFGGKVGNPLVDFDSEHAKYYIDENLVGLSEDEYKRILINNYSGGDVGVIQIVKPVQSSSCAVWDEEVVGYTHPLKFAFARTKKNGVFKYWIHSPTLDLLNNGIDNPLADGGIKAVRQTGNLEPGLSKELSMLQARCSNAPRTFLNQDSCQLLRADACSYDGDADIRDGGKVLVCGSPGEVANVHGSNHGPRSKGGFALYPTVNDTEARSNHEEQRRSVWTEIALRSKDQLRQRMAYALSQILVIGFGNEIGTEKFLAYYDMYV